MLCNNLKNPVSRKLSRLTDYSFLLQICPMKAAGYSTNHMK